MVDLTLDSADGVPELQQRTWDWLDGKANIAWVFGMRWLPALGPKGQKAIQRNLREQGFAWAVNHGQQVRLIGVQPQAGVGVVNRKMASAAVAFARSHPQGVHALCLEVQGMGVWMVASSEGCVLSDTDRWFDSVEQADASVHALRERYEQIAVQASQWNPEDTSPQSGQPAFLQAALLKHCKFCRLPSLAAYWVFLPVAAVALVGAGIALYDYLPILGLSSEVPEPTPVPAVVRPVAQIHPHSALHALLTAWHELPVDPEGWLLQSVDCRIDGAKSICKAAYKRREPGAHNEGLQRHRPQDWLFEAESIERAFYKRTIDTPMQPLQPHLMASTVYGLTQLQRLSPQVASLSIGTPARLQAPSPLGAPDPDHPWASETAGLANKPLTARRLTVRLALRHADRIKALSLPLRWREAQLSVVHGAQIDKLHGYLMLNLRGDWLETH